MEHVHFLSTEGDFLVKNSVATRMKTNKFIAARTNKHRQHPYWLPYISERSMDLVINNRFNLLCSVIIEIITCLFRLLKWISKKTVFKTLYILFILHINLTLSTAYNNEYYPNSFDDQDMDNYKSNLIQTIAERYSVPLHNNIFR